MCARMAALVGIAPKSGTAAPTASACLPRDPLSRQNLQHLKGPQGVVKTFVINLNHRRDRWDSLMEAEPYLRDWEAAGNLERFSAVNGKTMEMTEFVWGAYRA